MSKLVNDYLETTLEDEDGAEWDIRAYFEYQPAEKAEWSEGQCVYPGCEEDVQVVQVERNHPFYDVANWREFDDYSDKEAADWASEILELINTPD